MEEGAKNGANEKRKWRGKRCKRYAIEGTKNSAMQYAKTEQKMMQMQDAEEGTENEASNGGQWPLTGLQSKSPAIWATHPIAGGTGGWSGRPQRRRSSPVDPSQ